MKRLAWCLIVVCAACGRSVSPVAPQPGCVRTDTLWADGKPALIVTASSSTYCFRKP